MAVTTDPSTVESRGAVGWLLPLIVAGFLAADLVARSLPIESLCFQAWECMTRYQEPGAIFEANHQFRSSRTYGNLSNLGNLRDQRVYRPQVFTTDRFGFRNTAQLERGGVRALVVGDSFVAGYGLSDHETLSAQLNARTGVSFYNAGGPYAYLDTVRSLKVRLGVGRIDVIVVWTESEPIAQLQAAEAQATQPHWQARLLTTVFGESGGRVRQFLRGWWFTSPLKIVAQKGFVAISNDRIQPNVYAKLVVERHLENGETILFLPTDVEAFQRHRDVQPAHDYLRWLTTEMAAEGVRPLVVLVPHKYSVYYPLIADAHSVSGDAVHPLGELEGRLRQSGVEVMDLTPLLRTRAREELAAGRYLYWRDDTHWNGLGVGIAAEAIHQRWFKDVAAR